MGGVLLGQIDGVPTVALRLILPFLLMMLLGAFLRIPVTWLGRAFGNRRVVALSLVVNFVWNPLFAVGLGFVFLRDHPGLWVGLVMLMVTPCTDLYLVFTDRGGRRPARNLVVTVQPSPATGLVTGVPLRVRRGLVVLPLDALVGSVLLVLIVPLALAAAGRATLPKVTGKTFFERTLLPALGPVQVLFLVLAIGAMFASRGEVVLENPGVLLLMAVPMIVFYVVNFVLGLGIGRLAGFDYREVACFNCTILSWNSPTALTIAVVAFPHEPLVPLAR